MADSQSADVEFKSRRGHTGIYTTDFENEFISLTDIARYKSDEPKDVIKNWMHSKDTIEFLGLWEQLHNSSFKGVEFDAFKNQAGSNAFTILEGELWQMKLIIQRKNLREREKIQRKER